MRIYTRRGDDGTTSLLGGVRVSKDDPLPRAYGTVDEAQAAIGLARAECRGSDTETVLVRAERDLWVVMAELASADLPRERLRPGETLVTDDMVARLESEIDRLMATFEMPREFVVPGGGRLAASLDFARCVVRRAEREVLCVAHEDSRVVAYLNRLSDLLWVMARCAEEETLTARGDAS